MNSQSVLDLSGRRFRPSRHFRLVAIDQLTTIEREKLSIENDNEITAVLMPTIPFLSVKGICANTVRFLQSLHDWPQNPFDSNDPSSPDVGLLAKLVFDSVLEIEHEGRFLTGTQAEVAFPFYSVDGDVDTRAPARLSREALRYASALGISNPPLLSTKLYRYNRRPFSPSSVRRVGTSQHTSGLHLEVDRGRFGFGWIEVPPAPDNPSWRHFCLEGRLRLRTFKLYVSPHAEFLGETIQTALPVLSQNRFSSFKVCRDLSGLLRPDKFVAYAESRDQIDSASHTLLSRLRGMPAHVVPFTAAIDNDGLLSWGIDPPLSERMSGWQGKSWRRWITDHLAVAIIAAQAEGATDPSRLALMRLALEGVDVNSWAPDGVSWAVA